MKKFLVLTLVSLAPLVSQAKYDFNSMIAETNKVQNSLSQDMQKTLKVQAKPARRARIVVIEEQQTYVAKSKKDLLKFNKEKSQFTTSEKANFDRVATEFSQQ